jgi:hypothetical protein
LKNLSKILSLLFLLNFVYHSAKTLVVGKNQAYKTINSALAQAQNDDTVCRCKEYHKRGNGK